MSTAKEISKDDYIEQIHQQRRDLLDALKSAMQEIDWLCAHSTLRLEKVKEMRPAYGQIKAAISRAERGE